MRKADRNMCVEAPSPRMLAATAGLRRQLRIQTIVLTVVGIEVIIIVALRAWNAL
ncbi:hypothetical protein SAMN05192583_3713 [Sphingomonas gellani]|uniref:Uncharacterized protein n=1 Tax=Sphingomonas gellani TaxID=1166340 RepID=A0A1H8JY75_9SPHN|nr:hypothetical protein SAMN05192583_3713 [Sphingomonas gellani]